MVRGALCLNCRTALAPGERCDANPRHRVVRLDEPKERALALDAVWGPPHLRAKQIAKVGGTGGTAGGMFEGCGGCDGCSGADVSGELGAVVLGVVVALIAAIAIWWIVTRIVHAVRNHRARLRPQGAEPLPLPRHGVVAVVASGEAWGVRFQHGDALGTDVTLRDGEALGVRLTLDDGRVVVVPDGRARVEGDDETIDGLAHARRVDPEYREHDGHPVIPWERAFEVRIASGDRVELHGALDTRPDPGAGEVGYREAAPSILVPAGVAWLRKL